MLLPATCQHPRACHIKAVTAKPPYWSYHTMQVCWAHLLSVVSVFSVLTPSQAKASPWCQGYEYCSYCLLSKGNLSTLYNQPFVFLIKGVSGCTMVVSLKCHSWRHIIILPRMRKITVVCLPDPETKQYCMFPWLQGIQKKGICIIFQTQWFKNPFCKHVGLVQKYTLTGDHCADKRFVGQMCSQDWR